VSRQIYRALRRPVAVGREALPGSRATVVGRTDSGGYFVRIEGELWSAESPDALVDGERVYVLDVEGQHLIVCRLPPELMSSV
jgi:membrane protein implicated in regulation of membrane protease activity